MSTYEPGTVAVATVRGVPNVRVMRADASEAMGQRAYIWVTVSKVEYRHVHTDEQVTDVRDLVVLDPIAANLALRDEKEALRQAVETLRASDYISDSGIADQIEAQTRPPKPPEPTGLGAVVEDAEGRWTRARRQDHGLNWRREWGGGWSTWSDLDVTDEAQILSRGVEVDR